MAMRTAQGSPTSWMFSLNCSSPSASPLASRTYHWGCAWARACVLRGSSVKHLQITKHPHSTHGPHQIQFLLLLQAVWATQRYFILLLWSWCLIFPISCMLRNKCNNILLLQKIKRNRCLAHKTQSLLTSHNQKRSLALVLCSKPGNINSLLPSHHLLQILCSLHPSVMEASHLAKCQMKSKREIR